MMYKATYSTFIHFEIFATLDAPSTRFDAVASKLRRGRVEASTRSCRSFEAVVSNFDADRVEGLGLLK